MAAIEGSVDAPKYRLTSVTSRLTYDGALNVRSTDTYHSLPLEKNSAELLRLRRTL